MCDHCGCREFPPIGELADEHEVILARAWVVAEAMRVDEPPAPADVEALLTLLDLHIAKEELGLYRVLIDAKEVSISLVEELEAEHRDMRTRLVLGTFDRRDYYELAAHIETEEQELFPMTPFGLDEDDWDTMAEAHLEAVSLQGCSTGATEREG